jgi:hypothetical protein
MKTHRNLVTGGYPAKICLEGYEDTLQKFVYRA